MNESVFRELLGESLKREYAEFDQVPKHKFSLKHRRAMKRIFTKYEMNKRNLQSVQGVSLPRSPSRQRIVIAGIILVITAFLAGWVWICTNLYQTDHNTPEGYTVNSYAISRLKQQLRAEGIDVENRVPTHEITDEQAVWISSRHDLEFLKACSFTHEEFGNFMLDLAYINVFSFEEIENFYVVLPFNSNHSGYLYKQESGTEPGGYVEPFEVGGDLVPDDELQLGLIREYLKEKYTGLSEDEYEQRSGELFAQRAECLTVLEDFFARVSGTEDQTSSGKGYVVENIAF